MEGGGAGRGPGTACGPIWAHSQGRWCQVSVVPAAPASALGAIPGPPASEWPLAPVLCVPGWPSVPMPSTPGWPPALVQSPPIPWAPWCHHHHPAPTSRGPRWPLSGMWPSWDSSPGLLHLTLHSDAALGEDPQARLGFRGAQEPCCARLGHGRRQGGCRGCVGTLPLPPILLRPGNSSRRDRAASRAGGQPRREGLPGGLPICPPPETRNYESPRS